MANISSKNRSTRKVQRSTRDTDMRRYQINEGGIIYPSDKDDYPVMRPPQNMARGTTPRRKESWIASVVGYSLLLPLIVRILVSIEWAGDLFLTIMDIVYILLFVIGLTVLFGKLKKGFKR